MNLLREARIHDNEDSLGITVRRAELAGAGLERGPMSAVQEVRLVGQRYQAVLEVLEGATMTGVARNGAALLAVVTP